jgi:hypothetical protein
MQLVIATVQRHFPNARLQSAEFRDETAIRCLQFFQHYVHRDAEPIQLFLSYFLSFDGTRQANGHDGSIGSGALSVISLSMIASSRVRKEPMGFAMQCSHD